MKLNKKLIQPCWPESRSEFSSECCGIRQSSIQKHGSFKSLTKTETKKFWDDLEEFKFDPKVIAAVEEHHEDKPFSSLESVIVWIGDAISGSRPGARHEAVEDYVKRLKDIENIATSFQGVEKSFAISAGREVRVIVFPQQISDSEATKMANDVAKNIEGSVTYPGQVKVTVVREIRAEAIAK